jgi:CheY-like chemotaxis protein
VLAERPFDVVLTDLTMPRLSGMQLAEKIFDSGRKVPVVLMTAYGSTLDAEQVKQAGFAAVLSKPLVHDQVVATLARVVGRVSAVSEKR